MAKTVEGLRRLLEARVATKQSQDNHPASLRQRRAIHLMLRGHGLKSREDYTFLTILTGKDCTADTEALSSAWAGIIIEWLTEEEAEQEVAMVLREVHKTLPG